MKVHLMYKDRDFDPDREMPWNGPDLVQDLQLETIFNAMANGDQFLHDIARTAILSAFDGGLDTILYRQEVLKDCLQNRSTVTNLYRLALDAGEVKRTSYWDSASTYPPTLLFTAVDMLQMFVGSLKKLRRIADEESAKFSSQGFTAFFERIKTEISDEYLDEVQQHLRELRFRNGVLIGARLGKGNKGTDYVLRKATIRKSWVKRVLERRPAHSFRIPDRDEAGAMALSELNNRGINAVANAAAQSAEHVLSFFVMLQSELAFYLGCVNLHERLAKMGAPVTFPVPLPARERHHSFEGLYDLSLALNMGQPVVANDIDTGTRSFTIITGANKGGKTTFLRSIGLSQMMMQSGMFVPARSFSANICTGLFTHFKRREDLNMESGKLDEELHRMSQIADHLDSAGRRLLRPTRLACP